MKIITICGSLRFQKEMMEIAEEMELKGNCMLCPIYPIKDSKDDYTEDEFNTFDKMHKEKIRISDAILVLNKDNYIGKSTQKEIEYATSLNIEIIYYTDIKKNQYKVIK